MAETPGFFQPPTYRAQARMELGAFRPVTPAAGNEVVAPTPPPQLARARKQYARGVEHARADRWREALRFFEEAARCAPDQPNYHYVHGVALCRHDRFDEAIGAFQLELKVTPEHAPSLTEIGTCLARTGRTRQGIPFLQRGLARIPHLPLAQFSLGLALLTERRPKDAIIALSSALTYDGAYADAYRMRGLALTMEGEHDKAVDDLQAAAALDSKNHRALLDLGMSLGANAREQQAARLFEMAAKVAPDIALPQYVYGNFLINHRFFEAGLRYVDRAIELDPLQAEPYVGRGFGLLGQGRIDEAVAAYRRAGELKPESAQIAGTLLFALQHYPGVTKQDLLDAHKRWAALYRPAAPRDKVAFSNDPDPARKPRLGLVSADMHRHAAAFLTLRAFEQLAALGYEIFCYKTDRKREDDDFSERFKAAGKFWRDVSDLDDAAFAALVEEHKIDILFDLAGHTAGNRLSVFAQRAAPIQLSWAGYVGTIGLDTYDGVIADPVEIPPQDDEFYAEPVIRLPDCYVCYHPPTNAPDVAPLPALEKGAITFGCFNRPAKINSEVGRAWARIVEQLPGARILMVYGGLNESATQKALYDVLEKGGLSREHVELVGGAEQPILLDAYANRVDLALDPFPYSGGVTTLEAMWMGVPTVTFVGDTFAGRHSATHLSAAGLADFCTYSIDDYVALAVDWAKRPQDLAALRAGLRDKVAASPLNDPVRFGQNLSNELSRLWTQWSNQRRARDAAGVGATA
ncbi:putative O-linked N-acetylglucosamine transferase (SPINDLY family) [Methylosinus sp. sav-2]|jgi:predicted O-linked N-acetylglucosamine transferase (SPINDLY family)|uniref:tetratricopeptide repeat protein n=1 Tax=Methylosinus sp. sav-2 TaxID=2485168 RepID=UPI00068D092E|nr:tetratricopeptide repeat protein [Methylosinus sp. sav-2]TDX61378.1 putative O-linked N-acetylglucosamine transferase (SPINDLY family) [Methylosinus sp. sav-2]